MGSVDSHQRAKGSRALLFPDENDYVRRGNLTGNAVARHSGREMRGREQAKEGRDGSSGVEERKKR